MSAQPLVWGLVGASDIAAARMIPAMRRVGDKVVYVVSSDRGHAESYASRNDIPKHTTDIQALLADPEINAIYISSKNEHHQEQAISAMVAGKHVLCEKPIATNLGDALAMWDAAKNNGTVLAVNHHLPAAGTHRKIRELVADGAIGQLLSINVRHSTLLPERLRGWRLAGGPGAGVVMDLSCHNASVVNPLVGTAPLDVVASALSQGPWGPSATEDACSSSIRYGGGVLVDFQDSFTLPFTTSYIEVNGDRGSVLGNDIMTPEPKGAVMLTDSKGTREVNVADRRHTYDITLDHFRAAIRTGTRPIVDGVDAANTLALCLSILKSAASGQREPVEHTSR
ncbi:Gfo/Idh/MocA family protein [Paenarthrobacter sp. NPDC058040]|uniref:Gfo/Idh/MocA family protein n=1 Tax=unclassified Paenarthrobacter TaxID=2634190 RepID=UPI0036DC2621